MMSGKISHPNQRWLCVLNCIVIGLTLCCLFQHVESEWCTRIVAHEMSRIKIVQSMCNQSYQDSCGWFQSTQCTYYEMVDCVIEKNITYTQYRHLVSCCPGFKLDPINNETCITDEGGTSRGEAAKSQIGRRPSQTTTTQKNKGEKVTSTLTKPTVKTITTPESKPHTEANQWSGKEAIIEDSGKTVDSSSQSVQGFVESEVSSQSDSDAVDSSTQTGRGFVDSDVSSQSAGNAVDRSSNSQSGNVDVTTVQSTVTSISTQEFLTKEEEVEGDPTHHEKDESIFANLSSGAYTGIICALVFIMCVIILIGLHFVKKQRKLKSKSSQSLEIESSQKMLTLSSRA